MLHKIFVKFLCDVLKYALNTLCAFPCGEAYDISNCFNLC